MWKLFELGVSEDYPEYLNKRIRLSNQFGLLLFFLSIVYTTISYIFYPSLAYLPAIAIVICGMTFFINYGGFIYLSRLLLSNAILGICVIFHVYLISGTEGPIASLYFVMFSFLVIPFVLFDFRELPYLIASAGLGLLMMGSFSWTADWVNVDYETAFLKSEVFQIFSVFLGIIILYTGLVIIQKLNRNLEKKSEEFLKNMEEKNKELESSQEELNIYLQEIERVQEEEKKRKWASEGYAKFTDLLRGEEEFQKTCDAVISELVKYIEANQGGLYFVEEENEDDKIYLKLAGCYAYGKKKYMDQTFEPGQGLIGQAYMEKDYIFLKEIPQNYISITSGLGEATPNTLIIMPLINNEKVEGVVELASFKEIPDYQIEFLQNLGESLAAMMSRIKTNEKTKILLNETQQQAEEMKAQEEEMRQNMEELQSTQEEMARKEKEYQKKIEELEKELEKVTNYSEN